MKVNFVNSKMGNLINLKLKQEIINEVVDLFSEKYNLSFLEQKMIIEDLFLATKLFDEQTSKNAVILTNIELMRRQKEAKFKEEGK
jgi:hypothetical protein